MEPLVYSWNLLVGFLKLLILLIFAKNFESIQFKTKYDSISITHNETPKNCVILIIFTNTHNSK